MTLLDLGDVYGPNEGCEIYVTDDDGVLAAATVVLTITLPDGTTTTPSVTTPSTGRYQSSYKPTLAGTHYVRWTAASVGGVSGADSAEETSFTVSASNNTYLSLAEAKAKLNLQATTDDDEVATYLEVACDLAQQVADTQFARTTVVDTLSGRGEVSISLSRRPVVSVTTVTENGTALTSGTGYTTDLRWGRLFRQAGTYTDYCWAVGRRNIAVTYVAGYATIPTQVRNATLDLLAHLWETQRGPATSGRPSDADIYQVPGTSWYIPNRVRDVLMDYRPPLVA